MVCRAAPWRSRCGFVEIWTLAGARAAAPGFSFVGCRVWRREDTPARPRSGAVSSPRRARFRQRRTQARPPGVRPKSKTSELSRGPASYSQTLYQLVHNDPGQNDSANDGELKMRRDAQDVDGVVKDAHHGRADDHSEDGPLATTQAAATEHGGRDGVEFVKVPQPGRLNRVQVEGKQDTAHSSQQGTDPIRQYL